MFFSKRKKKSPGQVFTPRSAEVNKAMYVERKDLQQSLKEALASNYHIMLFGQSGSGKTWLYKGVLASENIPVVISNLANANRFGSIGGELENLIGRLSDRSAITTTNDFEINVADIIKKKWGRTIKKAKLKDPFEALLSTLYTASGKN